MPRRSHLPPAAVSALFGVALALTLPPLPTGIFAPLVLAGLLWHAADAPTPRQVAGRVWWAVFAMTAVHLWWLTSFLGNIFGFPPAGGLASLLYALEGGFFALMAYVVARLIPHPAGRVWALAGGWGVVEYLRFLGPLAFPWPTLGYALLPTPLIQIADLGGVLLASVLILLPAAAVAQGMVIGGKNKDVQRGLWLAALVWLAALGYGLTRTAGEGPTQAMRVMRTDFDSFGRASGQISPQQQFAEQVSRSQVRPAGSVLVWSETALSAEKDIPASITLFPGPGITGLGIHRIPAAPNLNAVTAIASNGQVVSHNIKAKLVPFGEYFPLYAQLPALYRPIEQAIGLHLEVYEAARAVQPLTLKGVRYGAYICYDSVFPWVARTLAQRGAQLLVNPSNDGWYQGWGVAQHFWMGRVRAIETRRWLVRSVNRGVAGAIDDLGRKVQVTNSGPGLRVLDVQARLLSTQTVYTRLGDWPALLLLTCLVGWGVRVAPPKED